MRARVCAYMRVIWGGGGGGRLQFDDVNGRLRLGGSCFTILSVKHFFSTEKSFSLRIVTHKMYRVHDFKREAHFLQVLHAKNRKVR